MDFQETIMRGTCNAAIRFGLVEALKRSAGLQSDSRDTTRRSLDVA